MLEIEGLSAWYGEARVLGDVSLSVSAGEVVTLVGRNGAGKTTLLRSVMGLHRQTEGVLRFAGAEINRTSPDSRAKAGLGWVPDDRGIYASLTVLENLLLPPVVHPDAWSLDQIFQAFPVLADRRSSMGTQLSGGEQQMLAAGELGAHRASAIGQDRKGLEDLVERPRVRVHHRGEEQVLQDGEACIDAAVIRNPPQARLGSRVRRGAVDLRPGETQNAFGLAMETHHRAQQRGLAGAIAADEGDDLTRAHTQGDVTQNARLAIPGG